MSEYISREAAIYAAIDAADEWDGGYNPYRAAKILDGINHIPAADVREVVRGKWLNYQQGRWVYAKCSECETVHDVRSNFCPHCGARMGES